MTQTTLHKMPNEKLSTGKMFVTNEEESILVLPPTTPKMPLSAPLPELALNTLLMTPILTFTSSATPIPLRTYVD